MKVGDNDRNRVEENGRLGVWQDKLRSVMDWAVGVRRDEIREYVRKLREQHPEITNGDLAQMIVRRKASKNAFIGAITGVPGLLLLPVTIPVDMMASWRIQAQMIVAIACVYGHDLEASDLKTDIYCVMAGNAAVQAIRQVGIAVVEHLTRETIRRFVTREVMEQIWKVLGRGIITKAGQKSLTSFMKWVPIVGAVVGAGVDWAVARLVGRTAIHYYSGRG